MKKNESKYTKEILEFCKEKRKKHSVREVLELLKKELNFETSFWGLQKTLSEHKIRGVNKGHFKNGHPCLLKKKPKPPKKKKPRIPHNKRKIGDERVDKDGYIIVKIANPSVWMRKGRYLYEKYHNVKLGRNDFIIFLDGDKRNFNKENLYRVTQEEIAVFNKCFKIHENPEATRAGILLSKIKLKKFERIRRDKNE